MHIIFERISEKATMPKYAHAGDSGMDVTSVDSVSILPHSFAKITTGLRAQIPYGYEIQVRPRSGLEFKNGIVAAFGTVDSGYRGEIGIALYNHSDDVFNVEVGDRIAQLVVCPVTYADIVEGRVGTDTERGESGFGSTGVN